MKLHIYEHCPFCTRARLAFGLKDVPVTLSVIMEGDAATPTRMIGKKAVPILEKDDGSFMGESLDIVAYVDGLSDRVFDGPADPALAAAEKALWKPGLGLFIPRFTRGAFAEMSTPEAREAYRLREERAFGDLDALMARSPELIAEITPSLEALTPHLESREAYGIDDITLWPVLRSLSIVRDLPFPTPVHAYMERIERVSQVPLLFAQAM